MKTRWRVVLVGLALAVLVLLYLNMKARLPYALVFPGANSHETYFSMHNVRAAQAITKGKGVRVGVLDHLFGTKRHPGLYAGGENFLGDGALWKLEDKDEHGYWMTLVLKEIAPDVSVFALNTSSTSESERVDAMVRAIDWAIAHKIDVLTYSNAPFSPEGRALLDPAVERAHAAGIVTTFIHYGHPDNLLPGALSPSWEDGREPDVNVLHYDYNVIFVRRSARLQASNDRDPQRAFLSMSSTSPVTAAVVAMVRSVRPGLSPDQYRDILRQSARPIRFEGKDVPRCLDAAAAVRLAQRFS